MVGRFGAVAGSETSVAPLAERDADERRSGHSGDDASDNDAGRPEIMVGWLFAVTLTADRRRIPGQHHNVERSTAAIDRRTISC